MLLRHDTASASQDAGSAVEAEEGGEDSVIMMMMMMMITIIVSMPNVISYIDN